MKLSDLLESDAIRWAMGPDLDKAIIKYRQRDPGYVVVMANIDDLFKHTDRYLTLDPGHPTGGANAIGNRVQRAKQHWAKGGHMDPSEIVIDTEHDRPSIAWQDGRHRLAAARQLGHQYGPVVLPRDQLSTLKSLVRVLD